MKNKNNSLLRLEFLVLVLLTTLMLSSIAEASGLPTLITTPKATEVPTPTPSPTPSPTPTPKPTATSTPTPEPTEPPFLIVPCPLFDLESVGVLNSENYEFNKKKYTVYQYNKPSDNNEFLEKYTALAEARGFNVNKTEISESSVLSIEDNKGRTALLFYDYGGAMLFMIEHGMTYIDGTIDTNKPPFDTLKKGDRGAYVTWLQSYLEMIGYDIGKLDGQYNKKTIDMVKAFQSDNGIEATGTVDRTTWRMIKDHAERASNERFLINNGNPKDLLYGFADRYGNIVIPCEYSSAKAFSCGLAYVCKDNVNMFIDADGEVIITLAEDEYADTSYEDGVSIISIDDPKSTHKIIDMTGKTVGKISNQEYEYSEIFAVYLGEGKVGIYNEIHNCEYVFSIEGKRLIKIDDERFMNDHPNNHFSEGLIAIGKLYEKYGYMNEKGKIVIPRIFDDVGFFSNGIAPAIYKGVAGFINRNGDFFATDYSLVRQYSEGISVVQIRAKNEKYKYWGGSWGIIDSNQNLISRIDGFEPYESVVNVVGLGFSEGLCGVVNDGLQYGFINTKGEIVIPYKWERATGTFDSYYTFKNGLCLVADGYNAYYVDKTGKKIIDAGIDEYIYKKRSSNSSTSSSSAPKKKYSDSQLETIAVNYLKQKLKNPNSLQVHSTFVSGYSYVSSGDSTRTVTIDYSAMNGFGGYNREKYNVVISERTGKVISAY